MNCQREYKQYTKKKLEGNTYYLLDGLVWECIYRRTSDTADCIRQVEYRRWDGTLCMPGTQDNISEGEMVN